MPSGPTPHLPPPASARYTTSLDSHHTMACRGAILEAEATTAGGLPASQLRFLPPSPASSTRV